MLHTEQPVLRNKSLVFCFDYTKTKQGLGSRQPWLSFPLCAPRLPLPHIQGRDLFNRQTGHLTTSISNCSGKRHCISSPSKILSCDVFSLPGTRNFSRPLPGRLHISIQLQIRLSHHLSGRITHSFPKCLSPLAVSAENPPAARCFSALDLQVGTISHTLQLRTRPAGRSDPAAHILASGCSKIWHHSS